MANTKFTAEQVIDALERKQGYITHAANLLGCQYATVSRYIENMPTVKSAYEAIRAKRGDNLEMTAFNKALKGDTTMLIFLLKTQFYDRGYTERLRIEGNINVNIVNTLVMLLKEKGFDPAQTFEEMIKRLETVEANGDPKLLTG